MGVRGLTGFIARHAELFLTPFELHDCELVVDGDNLACNLYKDVTGTYSAFGGDYDDYYRSVVEFFRVLSECNISPYVIMDGGYERRKLRTVGKRLRGKIAVIKRINPCGSIPVFPLLMKEVFVDAVRDCGVPVMRCVFEADDELATLSRKLRCPVLSYDSDFYIHNVRYIPLVTLTVKAHTKRFKGGAAMKDGIEQPQRSLRKNEAKRMEKNTKANRILGQIQVNNVEKSTRGPAEKTYKYLDCCMYRIKNLIARGSLSKEKLPLFAALLGNDYIARSAFKNFFSVGMGKVGRSRKMKQQQRRIRVIMQWLKHETSETALTKILGRLRKDQRNSLCAQVNAAVSGYANEKCRSYDFFKSNYPNAFLKHDANIDSEESSDEEVYVDEDSESNDIISDNEGDGQCNDESTEGDSKDSEIDELIEEIQHGEDELDETGDGNDDDKTKEFPIWFLEKLYSANLPRFFVDLIHLKKYINSPQIEHFPYTDCHEIALPILIYIFTLLNSAEGEEKVPRLQEDGTPIPIEFTYLTRATRVTNIRYYRYSMDKNLIKFPFNPRNPNSLLFRRVFEGSMHKLEADNIFSCIESLPDDLQLYFLAIIYWLQKSQHCDLVHLHSLLICIVVLRTVDVTIPIERDIKAFQKRFGKKIKSERLVREKEAMSGVKRTIREDLRTLPIPARMPFVPKSDCYLVQDNMLKHFHMQEIFKKKYDLYSTTVLHGFAEFQAVVFQLHSLNALLNFPYDSPRMGQLFCGVFLYNLYDLMRSRLDLRYFVQHFIFHDSQMMFDFYCYLLDWCKEFVPHWKNQERKETVQLVNKKQLKKKRQKARKQVESIMEIIDPIAVDDKSGDDEFFDLNNKFCTFLKINQ